MKCDHYWPFTEDPVAYGDITVEMLSEEEHTDWVYRGFRISYVSETLRLALPKEWEWFQSSLFFHFCPFLAFSGKHLREIDVLTLTPHRQMTKSQNFPLKLLSLNFSPKRKAETKVVPELWTLLWYQKLLTTNV